jgi:hypothetical protein
VALLGFLHCLIVQKAYKIGLKIVYSGIKSYFCILIGDIPRCCGSQSADFGLAAVDLFVPKVSVNEREIHNNNNKLTLLNNEYFITEHRRT